MHASRTDFRTTAMASVPDTTIQSESAETPPAPAQRENAGRERPTPEGDALDPTRYGDWEKNGRCIDF